MNTQKSIAQILDRAARRARTPATGKQVWFLAGVLLKQDEETIERELEDFIIGQAALDSKLASFLISNLLKN